MSQSHASFNENCARREYNQYWYSTHTIKNLLSEITHHATSCAFLSTPSLFFALDSYDENKEGEHNNCNNDNYNDNDSSIADNAVASTTDQMQTKSECTLVKKIEDSTTSTQTEASSLEKLRSNSRLFEYDKQWSNDSRFVYYDFTQPECIPVQYCASFDYIVADPPFITYDVWRAYVTTIIFIMKPNAKILLTTILENHSILKELLDAPLFIAKFKPLVCNLTYQYVCFTNYATTQLQNRNNELLIDYDEDKNYHECNDNKERQNMTCNNPTNSKSDESNSHSFDYNINNKCSVKPRDDAGKSTCKIINTDVSTQRTMQLREEFAIRLANDLRESELAFAAQMHNRNREGEVALPTLQHKKQCETSKAHTNIDKDNINQLKNTCDTKSNIVEHCVSYDNVPLEQMPWGHIPDELKKYCNYELPLSSEKKESVLQDNDSTQRIAGKDNVCQAINGNANTVTDINCNNNNVCSNNSKYEKVKQLREIIDSFKKEIDKLQQLLSEQMMLRHKRVKLIKLTESDDNSNSVHENDISIKELTDKINKSEEVRKEIIAEMISKVSLTKKIEHELQVMSTKQNYAHVNISSIVDDSNKDNANNTSSDGIDKLSCEPAYISAMMECVQVYEKVQAKKSQLQELAADATRKFKSPLFLRMRELLEQMKLLKQCNGKSADSTNDN